MALMLPYTCPKGAPPGEKEIFRRLRDDPGTENWTALHSLDIADHCTQVAGEADFVVLIPDAGIAVLEVKSHLSIKRDHRGWWYGNDPQPALRGPFRQAAEAMHSLRAFLLIRCPQMKSVLFWSAVIFPQLQFKIETVEWHDWQVLDRQRLSARPISSLLRALLEHGKQFAASKGQLWAIEQQSRPNRESCELIAKVFRPNFEMIVRPKVLRQKIDEELLRLTEQQFGALDHMARNRQVIFAGPAGSGKTVLAIEAARRAQVEGRGHETAFFCFNNLLGKRIAAAASENAANVTANNIDAWLLSILERTPSDVELRDSSFWDQTLPDEVVVHLLGEKDGGQRFKFLIIDEAQDLIQPRYLDILDLILEGGLAGGRWMLFGDFAGQDIFTQSAVELGKVLEERFPSVSRYVLNENCRNTKGISEYVVMLGRMSPPYSKVLREDDLSNPLLAFYHDAAGQMDDVSKYLADVLAEGFSDEDIVLLSPTPHRSCAARLAHEPRWSGRIAPYKPGTNRIRYTTVQKFKGMEAPVILLTDIQDLDGKYEESVFYVGLSRALHRLGIFVHENLKQHIRDLI
jgi:hypothetical protein